MKFLRVSFKEFYLSFYFITALGSALSSVAVFLNIEPVFNSVGYLSIALAAKTLFLTTAAGPIVSLIRRWGLWRSLMVSQLAGIVFLAIVMAGFHERNFWLVLIGSTLCGIPSVMLGIITTIQFRLSASSDDSFRSSQGRVGTLGGVAFLVAALFAAVAQSFMNVYSVLFVDALTYVIGFLAITTVMKTEFKARIDQLYRASGTSMMMESNLSKARAFFSQTETLLFIAASVAVLIMRGFAPLLAGSRSFDFGRIGNTDVREFFWCLEASAMILAGLIYTRFKSKLGFLKWCFLGNSLAIFPMLVWPNFVVSGLAIFVLSVLSAVGFQLIRDNYVIEQKDPLSLDRAAGTASFFYNLVLGVSPLILSLGMEGRSVTGVLGIGLLVQLLFGSVYLSKGAIVKHLRSSVSGKLGTVFSLGLTFLFVALSVMIVGLGFKLHNQSQTKQIDAWVKSLPKNIRADLTEGDDTPIISKVRLIEEAGVFKSFAVMDSRHRLITSFGYERNDLLQTTPKFPIVDDAGSVIGYFNYTVDMWSSLLPILPATIMVILSAVALFVVIGRLLQMQVKSEWEKVQLKAERARVLDEISRQLAHDIRSPLSALNMVMGSLQTLPEDKRLIIRNATQRINDIANGLLRQNKKPDLDTLQGGVHGAEPQPPQAEPVMLVSLLDAIVSEKRVQYRDRMALDIECDLARGYGLFAEINSTEFSRVISNLVNNSVEAIKESGRVTVAIVGDQKQVTVSVNDTGKGIPAQILENIGERGISFGKLKGESGSGLGLFHAKQTIQSFGGELRIESREGVGTQITITLPRSTTPKWFVEKVIIPAHSVIVSADDDQTIHQIWSGRIQSAGGSRHEIQHVAFSLLEQFESWAKVGGEGRAVFLLDYEFLGQAGNGLDAIERLGISGNAILVTSRYEERQVRARAEALGVKILPKALAPVVPIEIEAPREKYNAVLIDDDSLVHSTWQMTAKERQKHVLCFSTAEEFYTSASRIHLDSPLYIDVGLGNGVRGEEVALKAANFGFRRIHLATGYEASAIQQPACVSKVVGKDPLFD